MSEGSWLLLLIKMQNILEYLVGNKEIQRAASIFLG